MLVGRTELGNVVVAGEQREGKSGVGGLSVSGSPGEERPPWCSGLSGREIFLRQEIPTQMCSGGSWHSRAHTGEPVRPGFQL